MAVCVPSGEHGCVFSEGLASKLSSSLEGFNNSPYGHSSLALQVRALCSGTACWPGKKSCPRYCTSSLSALAWAKMPVHEADLAKLYPCRGRGQMPHTKSHRPYGQVVLYSRQVKKTEPGLPSASWVTWLRHRTPLCTFLDNLDKTTESPSTCLYLLWIQSRLSSPLLFLSQDLH